VKSLRRNPERDEAKVRGVPRTVLDPLRHRRLSSVRLHCEAGHLFTAEDLVRGAGRENCPVCGTGAHWGQPHACSRCNEKPSPESVPMHCAAGHEFAVATMVREGTREQCPRCGAAAHLGRPPSCQICGAVKVLQRWRGWQRRAQMLKPTRVRRNPGTRSRPGYGGYDRKMLAQAVVLGHDPAPCTVVRNALAPGTHLETVCRRCHENLTVWPRDGALKPGALGGMLRRSGCRGEPEIETMRRSASRGNPGRKVALRHRRARA